MASAAMSTAPALGRSKTTAGPAGADETAPLAATVPGKLKATKSSVAVLEGDPASGAGVAGSTERTKTRRRKSSVSNKDHTPFLPVEIPLKDPAVQTTHASFEPAKTAAVRIDQFYAQKLEASETMNNWLAEVNAMHDNALELTWALKTTTRAALHAEAMRRVVESLTDQAAAVVEVCEKVGNGDGANSSEHARKLKEDLKAYAASSRAVADAVQQDPVLQRAMQDHMRSVTRMALTAQRLVASVYVNAEMVPGLATGTRLLAGHRDDLTITEATAVPATANSDPAAKSESVAERRMRARAEGRQYQGAPRPPNVSLRAASMEALLQATVSPTTPPKAKLAEPASPNTIPMPQSPNAPATPVSPSATESPMRSRAKSTHNFNVTPTAESPDAKLSPVTNAGEARRQLIVKKLSAIDLDAIATTSAVAVAVPVAATEPAAKTAAAAAAAPTPLTPTGARGPATPRKLTDNQVLLSPASKRLELVVDTAAVGQVREMGQATSEADLRQAAAAAAAAAAGADEDAELSSPDTPGMTRRRTVSGGEIIIVDHNLVNVAASPAEANAVGSDAAGQDGPAVPRLRSATDGPVSPRPNSVFVRSPVDPNLAHRKSTKANVLSQRPPSNVDLSDLTNEVMAQLPAGKVIKVKEHDQAVMTLEWRNNQCVGKSVIERAIRARARSLMGPRRGIGPSASGGADRVSIVTADLPKLVERMADENTQDMLLVETVILTHTQFISSPTLLDCLIARYHIHLPPDATADDRAFFEKHQRGIKVKVLQVLVEWIKLRWNDFERHEGMVDQLEAFLEVCRDEGFANEVSVVSRTMSLRSMRFQKRIVLPKRKPVPGLTFTESTPLLSMEAQAIAYELAHETFQIFKAVTAADMLQNVLSQSSKRKLAADSVMATATVVISSAADKVGVPESIEALNRRSTQVTSWAAMEVVTLSTAKSRKRAIEKLLGVAKFCRDMNDFFDAFAIVNGLLSPPVHRLRKSWEGLPNRERSILDAFQRLMDSSTNMRNYREAYDKVGKPPCIPFFPIVQRELLYIYERNESVVQGLINYKKFELMGYHMMRFIRFQSEPMSYSTRRNEAVTNYVEGRVEMAPAEDMLKTMSLRCEE